MGNRIDLHKKLLAITPNVYFQPPESVKLNYPCIIYARRSSSARFADDILYLHKQGYGLTVIDRNPDSELLDKVVHLSLCSFDRHFTADNLNHDIYNLYY